MISNCMATREQLTLAFDGLLQPHLFKDYAPNGLQVEGKPNIKKIVSGVTANVALFEQAIACQADAVLVHHGLFWRGQDGRVTGWMKDRLALLLKHNINLYAYHLPLDAHDTLGNNAQLGERLGLNAEGRFGEQSLGWLGHLPDTTMSSLTHTIESVLGHSVVSIVPPQWTPQRVIRRIAWCSGGAQSYFESAIASGVDVFLTGEISEPQTHYARECGVAYLACGHHATERYGVQAVGAQVASQLGLEHTFVDIDNPA